MESFRHTKRMLSQALKGSVDSTYNPIAHCLDMRSIPHLEHYQAFAASLPHHASLLNHLTTTQTQISETRTSLLEAKENLGNKRADLVQLWSRSHQLEEMIKILDEMYVSSRSTNQQVLLTIFSQRLKSVPDLLETLMSEKRLLQAAILLVRSLKIINKPDMMEIGAISDLRSYLVGQEMARFLSIAPLILLIVSDRLLEIFLSTNCKVIYISNPSGVNLDGRRTSPVSSHVSLYYVCTFIILDAFQVPTVEFEAELDEKRRANTPSSPIFSSSRQSRLFHFLSNLATRANDPPYDISDQTTTGTSSPHIPPASLSMNNVQASSTTNPEADSFAYIETLLESLAVLGKLGSALDNIGQRLPGEVFALVETTLDEVEERAEYTRRQNNGSAGSGTSVRKSDSVYLFFSGGRSIPLAPSMTGKNKEPPVKSQMLRLAALESSAKQADHEVLKDLFWTLYSKLDAVAQGLRVVSEVANRIGSVSSSSALFLVLVSYHGIFIREGSLEIHLVQNQDHCSR